MGAESRLHLQAPNPTPNRPASPGDAVTWLAGATLGATSAHIRSPRGGPDWLSPLVSLPGFQQSLLSQLRFPFPAPFPGPLGPLHLGGSRFTCPRAKGMRMFLLMRFFSSNPPV